VAVTTVSRLACDYCPTVMKGRVDERPIALRERAERAGWKRIYGMPDGKIDACQVCAPKVGG
jgi:hypothetical protein